jgi:hypothetical protein
VGQENTAFLSNDPLRSLGMGGVFSTNDSLGQPFYRSKSPLIDQTITSTIGGGGGGLNSFNSIQDRPNSTAGLQSLAEEYRMKQKQLDERLKQDIENHKIASVFVQPNPDETKPA